MIVTTQEGVPQEVPYQHIVTTTQQVMKYNLKTNATRNLILGLFVYFHTIQILITFCLLGHN